ncbi:MAG: serine/threonine-protein kinase [Propionicimonas sp.]
MPDVRALGSRYELVERLGSGAMGDVWLARDRSADTVVAAKLLHRSWLGDPDVVARFVRERAVLLSLEHPRIVRVLDLVVEGDDVAIVMEHVGGGTLGRHLASQGTLPMSAATLIGASLLDGLAFAHSQDIVHRDVKPENVLLADAEQPVWETLKLADFGIARLVQQNVTRATGLLGTPAYMAPEMLASGQFSAASDVYAAGVLIYELLAGRTPFAGENAMAVGLRHLTIEPPRLPVPDGLWSVLSGLLAKDPTARPTAAGAATALWALSLPDDRLPVQPEPSTWRPSATPINIANQFVVGFQTGDIGQTLIPGAKPEAQPLITAGQVVPLAGIADVESATATMLAGGDRDLATSPVLASLAVPEQPRTRPPWWAIALGVTAVLAVAAGVAWWFLGRGGPEPEPPPPEVGYVPAYSAGEELPSGLRIDLAAEGGSQPRTVAATMTVRAPRASGLRGDVLIVFPATADGGCPATPAGAGPVPVSSSAFGLDVPCGFAVPVALAAGESAQSQFTVTGITETNLAGWLSATTSATNDNLVKVSGTGFWLQRIRGLTVTAPDVGLKKRDVPVKYAVYPEWSSRDTATGDPVFAADTLAFQATDLLLGLTGGAGFDNVAVTVCDQAQVNGHRVIAQQPANSCELQVRVGAMDPVKTSFTIEMAPS